MQLSPHFTLAEFTASDTARRIGNDNRPTASHLENLRHTAAQLERIRAIVGGPIVLTSGYRNPVVNRAVGGTPTSAHPMGFAADIRRPGLTPAELARRIRDSVVRFDQLILETGRKVVHVSFDPRCRMMAGEQRGGPGSRIVWRLPAAG